MLQLFLPLCKFSASICPLGYFHHHIWLHICCQYDTWNTVSGATTLHIGETIRELTYHQNKVGYKPIYHLLDSIVHCTFSDMHPCNHPCPWLLASMIPSFCKLFPSIFPLDRCCRHIRLYICYQHGTWQSQQSGECTEKLDNLLIINTIRSTFPFSSIRIIWFLALLGFAHFFCLFYWVFRWTSWGLLPFSIFAFYFLQYRVRQKLYEKFLLLTKFSSIS